MGKRTAFMLAAFLALATFQAKADVITVVPESARIPIPVVNYFGVGPESYGNYTWTSTYEGSVFGYTGGYGFGNNGHWDVALGPMAGLNDTLDAMTFTFTSPVNEIGDFINYVPGGGFPTTIAVYDTSDTLIESYNLTFLTPDGSGGLNEGEWLGFSETTPIGYFTLTNNYIGLSDPAYSPTVTPEPGSLLLLGTGLVGLAGALRRKLAR